MIIPGLTDVDLSAMANMTIEELNDLEHLANERAREFQMQLEAIQGLGGVSKDHANQFKGILPPQIALESFTGQVTNTNFKVCTESLSTAVKVAGVVGLVVVVGAVGFIIAKMMAGGKAAPKADAVEKVNKAAKGLDEFDGSADYRAMRKSDEERKTNLAKLIDEAGLTRCAVSMFDGMTSKPDMIVRRAKTLSARADELSRDLEYLLTTAIRRAEKIESDTDTQVFIRNLEHSVKHHGGGRSSEEAIKTIVGMVTNENYFDEADARYKKETLKYMLSTFPAYPEDDLKAIKGVRDRFKGEQETIEKAKKDLDGNQKISQSVMTILRDALADLSTRLKELDQCLVYVDKEIDEYNHAAATWGKFIGSEFESFRDSLMGSEMTKEEKAAAVAKLDKAYRG